MSNWIDEALREEMRRDMLRLAARRRLVAQAQFARGRRARFYSAPLAWLGCRLEVWGRGLQLRHGALSEATFGVTAGDRAR